MEIKKPDTIRKQDITDKIGGSQSHTTQFDASRTPPTGIDGRPQSSSPVIQKLLSFDWKGGGTDFQMAMGNPLDSTSSMPSNVPPLAPRYPITEDASGPSKRPLEDSQEEEVASKRGRRSQKSRTERDPLHLKSPLREGHEEHERNTHELEWTTSAAKLAMRLNEGRDPNYYIKNTQIESIRDGKSISTRNGWGLVDITEEQQEKIDEVSKQKKAYQIGNKDMSRKSNKQYRSKNKEKVQAYNQQYNEEYKEKVQAYNQQYNEEHKEEKKEKQRKYDREHKEEKKKYNEEHKEEKKQYNQKYYRDHEEAISENTKEYYHKNKKTILDQKRIYQESNRDIINTKRKIKRTIIKLHQLFKEKVSDAKKKEKLNPKIAEIQEKLKNLNDALNTLKEQKHPQILLQEELPPNPISDKDKSSYHEATSYTEPGEKELLTRRQQKTEMHTPSSVSPAETSTPTLLPIELSSQEVEQMAWTDFLNKNSDPELHAIAREVEGELYTLAGGSENYPPNASHSNEIIWDNPNINALMERYLNLELLTD